MSGLGKPRGKYGKHMDKYGVKQEDVAKATRLNRNTISKVFNKDKVKLRGITKDVLKKAAKDLTGHDVDF